MRRRHFLAGATTVTGLSAIAPALLASATASARTTGDSSAALTAPRILSEPADVTGAVVRPERRFDLVSVTQAPDSVSENAAVRFETAEGLGGWQDLHFHTAGPEHLSPSASAMARAPEGATGYEVRGADGADTTALNLHDGEELRLGGQERVALSAEDEGVTTLTGGSVLRVRTRAGWGADESLRFDEDGNDLWTAQFHRVQALTVHHTAMATTDDHSADVRAVYHLHAVQQEWGDVGYHLLIDPEGGIYEGRHSGGGLPIFRGVPLPGLAESVTGGHAFGFNHGNIGVCLLGDFTDELPTRAAQDSLVDVLRVLSALTGVDAAERIEYVHPDTGVATEQEAVARHRDWLQTECPGNAFSEVFDTVIRQRVVDGLL
ncbi:peptidoglycan recognition family protein [Nocardiopsis sp. L17-MgMaSL7]|uniref:peptidoglycan recognition protein family protein n=1 Tax=Nocardiopsis sp. L17-MgMaSL7 TaxID=1938893 RepID=UPI000D713C19|nr:peptidoglycan recognition family protein [Nocardiopsis sp. L17-MgMaSL7]PWV57591.1 N-acetylmuramoyl-L-alanine amidase [Nocardiopsis sp. L17-MgMaSL7]